MTRSGSSAMARAMPTRAFWPPESWCGKRSSRSTGRPTRRASSSQRARTAPRPRTVPEAQDRVGDGARGRVARVEAVGRVLEDHLDLRRAADGGRSARPGSAPMSSPVEDDPAGGRVEQPHDHGRGGRLAAAGFADEPDALAAPDLEGEAVHGAERRLVAAPRRNSARAGRSRPARGYSLTRPRDRQQRRASARRRGCGRQRRRRAFRQEVAQRRCRGAASPASACACRRGPGARKIASDGGRLDHAALLHHDHRSQ